MLRHPGLMTSMLFPVLVITAIAVLALYAASLGPIALANPAAVPRALVGASRRELAEFEAISPFFLMWLIFPVSVPSTLAAYSIVGEQEEGTLEPLLATPIRTEELLVGKALAAGLPGLLLVWIPWLATFACGMRIGAYRVLEVTLLSPAWILGLVVLAPCLTFMTVMLLVILSSRVNDVRAANQIGALLVLPLVLLFVGQVVRHGLTLSVASVLYATFGVLVLALLALAVALRLFQREAILVRWKQSR